MVIYDYLHHAELISGLKSGQVGVLPTDTLFGVVCVASNKQAVSRLYSLKSRENKPGTLIAASIDQLIDLGIPKRYLTAVEHFWPNPLSVIIPSTPDLAYLDLGMRTIAVRLPADKHINRLLQVTGPLLTTSANLPGQPPAQTVEQAQAYFADTVDFYVSNVESSNFGQPSTIIRIIDDAVEVIREGAVKINEKGEIVK